jgi:hypothetical protein
MAVKIVRQPNRRRIGLDATPPTGHNRILGEVLSKSRRCAYCGRSTDLTNEHVVPESYHKALGETISIVKTPSDDKAIPNPQEIRDVCANCNKLRSLA